VLNADNTFTECADVYAVVQQDFNLMWTVGLLLVDLESQQLFFES
jgi:hypothetical protein